MNTIPIQYNCELFNHTSREDSVKNPNHVDFHFFGSPQETYGISLRNISLLTRSSKDKYVERQAVFSTSISNFGALAQDKNSLHAPFLNLSNNGKTQFEVSAVGNIGIGAPAANERVTVDGIIKMTSGYLRFPDSSVQQSAFDGKSLPTNLLKGSSGDVGTSSFGASGGAKISLDSVTLPPMVSSGKSIKVICKENAGSAEIAVNEVLKKQTFYTMSFWARTARGKGILRVIDAEQKKVIAAGPRIEENNSWRYYSFLFNSADFSGNVHAIFNNENANSTIWLYHPVLVQGKITAEWSKAALEDAGMIQYKDSPSNKVSINSILQLKPLDKVPRGEKGDLYVNENGKLYFYNGTDWKEILLR